MEEVPPIYNHEFGLDVATYQKYGRIIRFSLIVLEQTIQQSVESHESAVRCVIEKGEALLESVQDPAISEKMEKLQIDYYSLCNSAQVRAWYGGQVFSGQMKAGGGVCIKTVMDFRPRWRVWLDG